MSLVQAPRVYQVPRACMLRGIALIESLVALLVLALGILGLAGVQSRLLVESRTSNSRAIAVGLIDDMNNRMLFNRTTALANGYALAWNAAATAAQECSTKNCTGVELAQFDLYQWRATLASVLPGASASIFVSPTDSRQIGIAVAWRLNESKAADNDAVYTSPFAVTAGNAGVDCPANSICHFVYVQP